MKHLFTYGTLMCKDIMEHISGCHLCPLAGVLRGYSRRSVKGEPYPAILANHTGHVEGLIYKDVPNRAWKLLDQFEGHMYARHSVQINLDSGVTMPADTYVIQPAYLDRLTTSDWNFSEFLRKHKESFQRDYR